VPKYVKDAENVFALLVIVSIGALKRALSGKTVLRQYLYTTMEKTHPEIVHGR
jgi:hypothetical protein